MKKYLSKKTNTINLLIKVNGNISSQDKDEIIDEVISLANKEGLNEEHYNIDKITRKIQMAERGFSIQAIISSKQDSEYIKVDVQRTAYSTFIDYEIYRNRDAATLSLVSDQTHKRETYLALAKGYSENIVAFLYDDEVTPEMTKIHEAHHMIAKDVDL